MRGLSAGFRIVAPGAAILLLTCALSPALQAQGVRGGADSVRVRVAGVERGSADGAEHPGSRLVVRVAMDHATGFHSWPDEPVVPPELKGLNAIATAIEVASAPDGIALEHLEWPEPVTVTVHYTAEPLDLLSFTDTTVARLVFRLPDDEPRGKSLELAVRFQSCDERYCYPPRREVVSVPIAAGP